MTKQTPADAASCPTCGKPLAPDAPRGLCLPCLFRGASNPPSAPRASALPRRMGDYELLELIARGGMGLVYKARHLPLNRLVALKVIAMGEMAAPDFVERFRVEARAAASLDHPHIVPIYEIGEHEGQQFFSMRLIEGRSLAPSPGADPALMEPQAVAALMAKVARATHYAHQHGILHRDIKPGNILLDARGEPFLTDFGLAKLMEVGSDVTQTIATLGTPAYMSPEQARGETRQLTTASDVYSLGAVLYELLAGRPPFSAASGMELLRKVVEEEPAPPLRRSSDAGKCGAETATDLRSNSASSSSAFGLRVPDLHLICLKCLSKEPARRYASAEALAEDLERWQRGEPINARATTGAERVWLWCRRRPRQTAILAALAAVVVAGVAGVFTQWRRAEVNRARAEQNSQRLESEKAATRLHLYASDMSAAMGAWRDGNLGLARRLLDAQRPTPGTTNDLRGLEWRFLWQLLQGDQSHTLRGHGHLVTGVAFAPDGKRLVSGGLDGQVNLWDTETGTLLTNLSRRNSGGLSVAFSHSGHQIAAGMADSFLTLDLRTGLHTVEKLRSGVWVAASPVSDLLLVGDGGSYWYGHGGGTTIRHFGSDGTDALALPDSGARVAISADGRIAATGLLNNRIRFWRVPSGEPIGQTAELGALAGLALSRDGSQLVGAADFSPKLRIWSVRDGARPEELPGHELSIQAVATSPVADLAASAGRDQKILLWDLARREVVDTLTGHESEIHALAFSPDGEWLASGSKDLTVRLWPMRTTRRHSAITNLSVHYGFGAPLMSPDGKSLAASSIGPNGVLMLFDTLTLEPVRTFGQSHRPLAFSPDGNLLVSIGSRKDLVVWDAKTGAAVGATELPVQPALEAMSALSPDGATVALGGNGTVAVCDVRTGRLLGELGQHNGLILSLAYSPDGRRLVTTGQDNLIRVWDTASWSNIATLHGHIWHVRALAFSPDGRLLASGGHDNLIRIWDMTAFREITTLRGNRSVISALSFAPDGATLVSASDDTVRFWSAATWREVGNFKPPVTSQQLVLSPAGDGLAVAEAVNQGPLHFWRVPPLGRIDGTPERPGPLPPRRWRLQDQPPRETPPPSSSEK